MVLTISIIGLTLGIDGYRGQNENEESQKFSHFCGRIVILCFCFP